MDSYPSQFVSKLKELARDAALWIGAQAASSIIDASTTMTRIDQARQDLVDMQVLRPELCYQLRDIALTTAAVSACTAFGLAGVEGYREDVAAACDPRPGEVTEQLWRRTQDFFWSTARLACAEEKGDATAKAQEQRISDRHARFLSGHRSLGSVQLPPDTRRSFSDDVAKVMPSTVVMFSTHLESSTTGPTSPRTPFSSPVEGRCTELLLKALRACETRSWMELLWAMRKQNDRGRTARQVPSLSCSCMLDLDSPFSAVHPQPSGRRRALLVGINYVGQEGLQMSVGHSDVKGMQAYLLEQGYKEEDMRILVDDGSGETPSRRAIEAGLSWLVMGAQPGDSLFFLYSGHGSTFPGDEGEADEALCPVDFRSAGMVYDDDIFRLLVAPLQEGVQLVCVVDCCQSGTVLHLPYVYAASEQQMQATKPSNARPSMEPNKSYDQGKLLQVIQQHPAMCAAATFWAEELASLSPSHRKSTPGIPLWKLTQSGHAWANS